MQCDLLVPPPTVQDEAPSSNIEENRSNTPADITDLEPDMDPDLDTDMDTDMDPDLDTDLDLHTRQNGRGLHSYIL